MKMAEPKVTVFVDENHQTTKDLHDAKVKLSAVSAKRAPLEHELDTLLAEQRRLIGGTRAEKLGHEAAALLDGRELDEDSSLSTSIARLLHELEVVDEAVRRQQQIVADARGAFSRVVCDHPRNKATYIAIQK